MVRNPRFPHTLRVLRPEVDEYGNPVFDSTGTATFTVQTYAVVRYEGFLPIYDDDSETGYVTDEMSEIPYGYRQQTANAVVNGDAIITEMKIACPIIIGEIRTGDVLELTDDDKTFHAKVVKKINTNFGTNIWYHETKQ